MTLPRKAQVSLSDTPYYHCIARCVRRAFLCGEDRYSGQCFEHRRAWLVERLEFQASVFGIDICAYAIMNNHYHVVLRVDRERVIQWTDQEVIDRWTSIFSGPLLVREAQAGKVLNLAEQQTVADIVRVWRQRLYDLSWFMRCLNEFISRKANAEDGCTGRFWEGRFKSQALLDQTAVLSCMAYVDLNPVRAGIASSLLDSDFTSIQERLKAISGSAQGEGLTESALLPFSEGQHVTQNKRVLPYHLKDYIELVDATARKARPGKRGVIAPTAPRMVTQLGLTQDQWLKLVLDIQPLSLAAIGELGHFEQYSASSGRAWMKGKRVLSQLYGAG